MYPKTFTSRYDHKSQVVIANAEQEAQLPDEYLPDGPMIAAISNKGEPSIALEDLEQKRTEFAQYMASEQRNLADDRAKLQADRLELTEGYKASLAQLEADRAAHAAEVEAFNKSRENEQAAADSKVPAKRTREVKAD